MIDELANTAKQVPVSMNIQVSGVRLSKDSLHMVNSPLCVVIGLVNKKREEKGIFGFEFNEAFAKYALGCLMLGYNVDMLSEIGLSALLELANMMCGNMLMRILPDALTTPPTAVFVKNAKMLLNTAPCYRMILDTPSSSLVVSLSVT
jgi:chemotaxis protein CheX